MTKAQRLLEKVKDVASTAKPGTYTLQYEITKDISAEVARHSHSDNDEFAGDVLDDVVHYYQKVLNKEVWDKIRNIPGVGGLDLDVHYKGAGQEAADIDQVVAILKKATFEITANVLMDLETKEKVEIDTAIKDVLEH